MKTNNHFVSNSIILKIGLLSLVVFSIIFITIPASVDASIIYPESSFVITCSSGGQLCSPSYNFSINLNAPANLQLTYTVGGGHCSSVKIHVLVDGTEKTVTSQMGWPGVSSWPLTTLVDLSNISSGSHTIGLRAEGINGGCNHGSLLGWGGSVAVNTANSSPLSVSCSALPNSANTNQTITFNSSASGGTGSYIYSWSGDCTGLSQSCSNSFSNSGTHTATVSVISGTETASASCPVLINQSCASHSYKQCYLDDLYWYDSCGSRQEIYQDCGDDSWTSNYQCSGNWLQRQKTDRGCSSAACYQTNCWTNYQECSLTGQTCQNNQCHSNSTLNVYCYASPSSINTNQSTTFISSVSGGTGSYTYSWSDTCTGSSTNCTKTFSNSGNYTAGLTVYSGGQTITTSCSVNVNQNCTSHSYKQCYNNDSYWYDSCNNRQELYENCGSGYCQNGNCVNNNYSNLSVSCSASPSSINTNQSTTFISSVFGGTGYYNYLWLGACASSYSTCNNSFSNTGTYTANLTIISGGQTARANCSVNVGSIYYPPNNVCECSSGPCCDGCHYKNTYTICNSSAQTEYGCPWGSAAGSDVGVRTKYVYQYCSGYSASCNGRTEQNTASSSWLVSAYCNTNETCFYGYQACQPHYTPTPTPPYYFHYTKQCYNSDVYWLDSNGIKQDLYKNCQDNNTCTQDSCAAGKCINTVKCDGTTCSKSSIDYCNSCQETVCGDEVCNCNETISSCSQDCSVIGLALTLFGKKSTDPVQWTKTFTANADQDVNFLAVISNGLEKTMDNVSVRIDLPQEIIYKGSLALDGNSYDGDIRAGINLGSLAPKATRTITFDGQISQTSKLEADVIGTVQTSAGSSQDSVKISFQNGISFSPKSTLAALATFNFSKPLTILIWIIGIGLALLILSRLIKGFRKE